MIADHRAGKCHRIPLSFPLVTQYLNRCLVSKSVTESHFARLARAVHSDDGMTTYSVIDGQTGRAVRSGLTKKGALRAADRLDNAYGAYRYRVVADAPVPCACAACEAWRS